MYSSNNPPHYWFSASRPTGAPLNGIEIPGWFQNLCIRWDFGKHLIFQMYPYLSLKSPSYDLETSSDKRLTVSWSRPSRMVCLIFTKMSLLLINPLHFGCLFRCVFRDVGAPCWARRPGFGLDSIPYLRNSIICEVLPVYEPLDMNSYWIFIETL